MVAQEFAPQLTDNVFFTLAVVAVVLEEIVPVV
jgi:hypothetical protein